MKKVIVYGETVRQARNGYRTQPGETVGHRTYEQADGNEKADKFVFLDDSKAPVKKKKKGVKVDD